MKIIKIILAIIIFDFVASNLFFKKMNFWEYDKLTNQYWRVPSKIYHHGYSAFGKKCSKHTS